MGIRWREKRQVEDTHENHEYKVCLGSHFLHKTNNMLAPVVTMATTNQNSMGIRGEKEPGGKNKPKPL